MVISVYCISLCTDSHIATVVKVKLAVSMKLGGESAPGGRWEECNEWGYLSMHTSQGGLR